MIRYNPKDIEDLELDVEVLYPRLLVQIEHLQNLFFAERLLQRHAEGQVPYDGELLLISFDMVVLTLTLWVHKNRFVEITKCLEWLVRLFMASMQL